MADTFELYSLTSRLELDTAQFDRAYGTSRQRMQTLAGDYNRVARAADSLRVSQGRLSQAFGGFQTSVSSLGGPLANITNQVTSLGGAVAGLPGPLALAGAAVGALATAVGLGAGAIYNLVVSVSDATGKFIDLSQQTGFSVETLSALSNAAETSGGSIDTVVGALGIFETRMQEAKEKGSEMSKMFKVLGVDTTNHEKALRQALDALTRLSTAEEQASAGKKLFGRSYRELLAAIKEAGDLDAYLNQELQKGTLITTDAAKAGDVLSDAVVEMSRAFDAVRRIVADEFGPDVLRVIQEITTFLEKNRGTIRTWAADWYSYLKDAASGAKLLTDAIMALNANIGTLFGWGIPDILKYLSYLSPGAISGLAAIGKATTGGNRAGATATPDYVSPFTRPGSPGAPGYRGNSGNPFDRFRQITLPVDAPKGKGGGGGSARDPLDAVRVALVQLNAEYRKYQAELLGSAKATSLAAEKEKILANLLSSIKTGTKERIGAMRDVDQAITAAIGQLPAKARESARALLEKTLAQFNDNQETKIAIELNQKAEALTRSWRLEMDRARGGTDEYTDAIADLEKEFAKYGVTIDASTRKEIEQLAAMRRELDMVLRLTRARQVLKATRERVVTQDMKNRPPWVDLGGGSTVGGEPGTTERPRIATVDEQVRREREARLHQQVEDFAADLTFTIEDAIREGFRSGMKEGVIAFGQGILEMAAHEALSELKKAIADALFGALDENGNGGIFRQLLSKGIGLLLGALGGSVVGFGGGSIGSAGAAKGGMVGAKATGGWAPPFSTFRINEYGEEYATAGPAGATVIPAANMVGGNVYMNVYTNSARDFNRPETMTQIRNRLRREMSLAA